ncbi:MAG TPA: polysaccharide ABC transporter ATP-binding protein [Thermoanaerobaculia bacterium]|jgi:lipopolysaccharide transport system ATP-binding protein|nr:polysaccharide ABC transporter ATP-binding protein [Thermoanaerobaculia bacterium]
MGNVVTAVGVGKQYRMGSQLTAYSMLRDRVGEMLRAPFRKRESGADGGMFWALKDVAFDIEDAEVVGLIGRNGAGKSTLLKILSRITEPTEGEIHLHGRTSSLLEVGIGFHPELTGRENIFLNGAILGMHRSETKRKFHEIVEFADIGGFLDTPVKRYSSGMYVRLAFAVAAHLEPDILIVDEVLAVGDAAFQQKCLGKMRSIRSEGRTVIVVSHSMSIISSLCQKVIWIDQGKVRQIGPTMQVVPGYLSEGAKNAISWSPRLREPFPLNYDTVYVARADTGVSIDPFPGDVAIEIVIAFTIDQPLPPGRIEVRVQNEWGEILFASTSADHLPNAKHEWKTGPGRFRCRIPPNFLAPGVYHVSITEPRGGYDILRDSILSFAVSEENNLFARDGRPGKIAPLLEWHTE